MPAERPRRRVLVVEDDEDSATVLALLLSSDGHDVRTVPDGRSALEMHVDFQPELVLCDLSLLDISGIDVAVELRRQRGREGLMLVAMTGWDGEEVIESCRSAGFDGHLLKPIQDFQMFRHLVRELELPATSRL